MTFTEHTAGTESAQSTTAREEFLDLKIEVHELLIEEVHPSVLGKMSAEEKIAQIKMAADSLLKKKGTILPVPLRQRLVSEVMDEVVGYGPIQPLLDDPSITEVMVNGPRRIYVERAGKLTLTDRAFKDDDHVLRIIDRIVAPIGRRVDESMPMVDARLPDGSRVNVIIPPLAVRGPTVTIRKFSKKPYTGEDLVGFGTMTHEMMEFLKGCVAAKLNILVSGGTGSGKTTTLNVLSSFIPHDERIVTIEDAAELQLQQDHIVTLESRPPNIEGKGEIGIRQLVRNALRMRPDRIVVGEVRGGEALDMLQAMNTGHEGSLTTAHTNNPRDAIARLETMVLMAGTDLPIKAIREQIASAIDLIVHQSRLRDGTRRVTYVTEIQGMEGDTIVLQDLFRFEQKGISQDGKVIGEHVGTGLRPKFINRLLEQGVQLPTEIFAVTENVR